MIVAAFAEGLRRLPRALLLGAIRFYKRFVSPHKGYRCAYRVHTGCASCSTLGYRAVARYGVRRGLGVLRLRLEQCRLEHERHERHGPRAARSRQAQAGFVDCDLPCDGSCADASSCEGLSCDAIACGPGDLCGGLDFCSGVDGGGDWSCGGPGPSANPAAPVRERGRRRRRGTPPGAPPDAEPGPVPDGGDEPA